MVPRTAGRPRIEATPLKTSAELVPGFRLRAIPVALALAFSALLVMATPAFAATYDPLDVIPSSTFHASSSMTTADIQTLLSGLSGPLKSVVASDYAGVPNKTAAQIVWEAARAWNLNPKIILVTLQKEQGLLTTSNSSNAARLVKAMGCGVYGAIDPATGLTTNRYPGFGNQVWNGARLLSTYESIYLWIPGMTKSVTVDASGETTLIVPANASTFALYTYTPHYPQKLIWDLYVQYFGDPHAAVPINHAPVAVADGATVAKNGVLSVTAPGVLGNDTDADGNQLSASLVTGSVNGTVTVAADGSYSYTPTVDFTGTDSFTYRAFDGVAYSGPVTVTVTTLMPSAVALTTKSSAFVSYGSAFVVGGTLTGGDVGLSDLHAILQSSTTGTAFKDTSYGATTGAAGAFLFSVKPTTKTYYRVRFAGTDVYSASYSAASVYALPGASVGTPVAASTMSYSKSYTVYMYLKPRHTSGSYPVRIYKYRLVSGKWASYGYSKAKAANYSSYTKCSVALKLTAKGRWRVRAYAVADSGHAATWSGAYDYVTVK